MGSWTYWSWCQGWRLDMDSETLNSTHQCWSGYEHGWKLNLLAAETNTKLLIWYHALPTQGSHLRLLHCRQILYHWATGEAHEETHFTAKEMWQWAHDEGICWSSHVSYYPDAVDLMEQWKQPFEDSVTVVVRWPWFARLGPPEDCIYPESVSSIGAVSPIARIHRSEDWGVETGMTPLNSSSSAPLAKFYFLFPWLYAPLVHRSYFQREECFHQEIQQWCHWTGS